MRTTARLLTSASLAAAVICVGGPVAYAGDHESLEIFPATAEPGATVTVNTTACGRNGHGVGDARSLGAGEFHLSPGTHKDTVEGQFRIPERTEAGTYGISVRCKNGKRASGDVTVQHRRDEQSSGQHQEQPTGHVRTGVGGSVGPDTVQIAAGAAVLTAAAVSGALFLRRRASGVQGG
ncbi:hypothetical protein ACFQ61_17530 [Streptomyces sp. NPDC056500]|uniref:hypothetical protein n=1 Tax=Streptomyces sp. NPDC056500 TaxID=3345840 RepID=UPI003685CDB4